MPDFPTLTENPSYLNLQFDGSNMLINQKSNLGLPAKRSSIKSNEQSTPQSVNWQFRKQSRNNYIQKYKKAVRFEWNVQKTLEYLRSVEHKQIESQQVIQQAIDNQNIEYLVELIVAADQCFRTALVSKGKKLIKLILKNIHIPSSVMLLGNLCNLHLSFIHLAAEHQMFFRITRSLSQMKLNEYPHILSWTLTQIARQSHLLCENEVNESLPFLLSAIISAFYTQHQHEEHCTHLTRVLSKITLTMRFPEDFLINILEIKPMKEVDKINMLVCLARQAKQLSFSQNNRLRIHLIEYLLWVYPKIRSNKLIQAKLPSIFSLIDSILENSTDQVSKYVACERFDEIISQYSYGNLDYYKMLHKILHKLSYDDPQELLQKIKLCGLIQNLLNDITDPNHNIGYQCLLCVKEIVIAKTRMHNLQDIAWMQALGLRKEVQEFLGEIGNNKEMMEESEKLLDMINKID